jgi:hypothetical protein
MKLNAQTPQSTSWRRHIRFRTSWGANHPPPPPPGLGYLARSRNEMAPLMTGQKGQQRAARQSGHRVPSTPVDALLIVCWLRWPPFSTELSICRQPGYHTCGTAMGDPQERVNIGLSGVQPIQLAQPPASMPRPPGAEVPRHSRFARRYNCGSARRQEPWGCRANGRQGVVCGGNRRTPPGPPSGGWPQKALCNST